MGEREGKDRVTLWITVMSSVFLVWRMKAKFRPSLDRHPDYKGLLSARHSFIHSFIRATPKPFGVTILQLQFPFSWPPMGSAATLLDVGFMHCCHLENFGN